MKLFKLTLGNGKYSYVVASNSKWAEDILLKYLNKKDWYFVKDSYVSEVLFLAEEGDYPLGGIHLFVDTEAP